LQAWSGSLQQGSRAEPPLGSRANPPEAGGILIFDTKTRMKLKDKFKYKSNGRKGAVAK